MEEKRHNIQQSDHAALFADAQATPTQGQTHENPNAQGRHGRLLLFVMCYERSKSFAIFSER
jgi:hypothetical protein